MLQDRPIIYLELYKHALTDALIWQYAPQGISDGNSAASVLKASAGKDTRFMRHLGCMAFSVPEGMHKASIPDCEGNLDKVLLIDAEGYELIPVHNSSNVMRPLLMRDTVQPGVEALQGRLKLASIVGNAALSA